MPFGSFAAFVLPVFFLEKRYVHTPNEHRPAALHTFGGVNCIAPDDVPPRVVVVDWMAQRSKPSVERATVGLAFSVQVYNAVGPNHTRCAVCREG